MLTMADAEQIFLEQKSNIKISSFCNMSKLLSPTIVVVGGVSATLGISQSCHGVPAETLGTEARLNIQVTGSSGTFIYGNLVLEFGFYFEFKPFFVQTTL